jgi:GNAT superfamily N-acetyltransferase
MWSVYRDNSFSDRIRYIVFDGSSDREPIGVLVAHVLEGKKKTASVSRLEVKREWRRKGVATELMNAFLKEWPNAILRAEPMFSGEDEISQKDLNAFYRRLGGRVDITNTVHFGNIERRKG